LWHIRFVTGLQDGRIGLIQRTHHALVDGVSGVDIAAVLLDLSPEVDVPPASTWVPAPPPTAPVAALDAVRHQLHGLAGVTARTGSMLVHPTQWARSARTIADVVTTLVNEGVAPRSSLNQKIGTTRRLGWIRADLAAVKAAGADLGATANDVVLTAVAAGLRHVLLARGEAVAHDAVLKVLVPVSVRGAHEHGALGNRVSGLVVPLPIGLGDPDERLRSIVSTMARLKAEHGADAAQALLGAADLLPPAAIRLISPVVHRQPFFNLVVTNVPGPNLPLYMLGARMLEAFPIVPLTGDTCLGVAVLSYDGALNIGLIADVTTCPDLEIVVEGIEHGLREVGAVAAPIPA
jgi:WS/DGAT/MGAT family acyltransferase